MKKKRDSDGHFGMQSGCGYGGCGGKAEAGGKGRL